MPRSKMVSKLVSTHSSLRMREETLFLAVYLMDKYVSLRGVKVKDIDLLLVTILFIAAKYEETIYVKLFRIMHAYSNYKFDPAQVIALEAKVLGDINFKLNIVCPYDFLKRLFLIHKIDDQNLSELTSRRLLVRPRGHPLPRPLSLLQELRAGHGRLRVRSQDPEEGSQPQPEQQVHLG